ncbi:MAG: inositol 2-dehydrogenase [Caldilineaceae bacterium]
MSTKLNFGLIGAGRIGRVHAESLTRRLSNVHLRAVTDLFPAAAQTCANDFQIPHVYADQRALLDDPQIDAVLICSATETHTQFIIEAAQAGKHIFCEKPIALDLAKIDAALAAVHKAGVKLQIGFNRRFDANFRHLHETVKAGGIGDVHLLQITSRDPAPPPISYVKGSGGIFLDMTIHDFDMARYLVGDEVEEVYATGGVRIDPAIGEAGDIDTAVITLRFKGGAIGVINNSRQAVYGYDQRAEVFGSKGAIEAGNNLPHNTRHSTAQSVDSPKPLHFFLERYMDSYANEMRGFVEAIEKDIAPPVSGMDGRIPVVMGLAAGKSYRENRPVRLSEVES